MNFAVKDKQSKYMILSLHNVYYLELFSDYSILFRMK